MKKTSVKPKEIDEYANLDLIQLDQKLHQLQEQAKASPSPQLDHQISALRVIIQQRQRFIKARAIEFEQTNNRHLLFFQSTNNFVKVAGHSALFFAATIAERIHWRYSLKVDTDHYSVSEDGIISFRDLGVVEEKLAAINVFPDHALSTPEFHYYQLAKVYNDEQIAKLRDSAKQDIKRIMNVVLPASPLPTLYDAIAQANQLIYFQFKHLSDGVARDTIGKRMIMETYDLTLQYLQFANSRENSTQYLVNIIKISRSLRYGIAYVSKLQILHHRELCKTLEQLVAIERLASKAYLKAKDKDKKK